MYAFHPMRTLRPCGSLSRALPHFGASEKWMKPVHPSRICRSMPLYYLHVCNGTGFVEDEEGLELPGLEAARSKAIDGLRDIMAAEMRRGEINMGAFIEIEGEDHQLLTIVPFSEAVRVSTEHGQGRDRSSLEEKGPREE